MMSLTHKSFYSKNPTGVSVGFLVSLLLLRSLLFCFQHAKVEMRQPVKAEVLLDGKGLILAFCSLYEFPSIMFMLKIKDNSYYLFLIPTNIL